MDTAKLSMEELRSQLLSLLGTLQTNREKVPLDILKTRYKKGYDDLPEAALLRFRICQAADAIRHPDTQGLSGGRRFPRGASHQNFRYPERTFLRYLQNVGHGCL